MKNILPLGLLLAIAVSGTTGAAYAADDNVVVKGAKKAGSAIVWPFKKLGQGLKAMGSGAKKMVGK